MVEIVVAEHAGFCFGVKRAINLAEEALKEGGHGSKVFSLGPLIHNPQEVKRLEGKGLCLLESEDGLKANSTVIVRSHGIPPQKEAELLSRGVRLVDATCPFVKAVHEAVVKLSKEGYFVVLVGEKNHPEVIGTLGYLQACGGRGVVVETKEDLKEVLRRDRVGLVAQTTQNEQFFKEVVGEIALWAKELKVINTICNATSERQEDVYELAPQVDVMIVVGGKNSGNTRRLYEIAKSLNPRSYHIETPEELKKDWFEGVSRVGITAGASTPDWIIREVVSNIEHLVV
ncbi:MAG: 4-hydroxy-3-methylbut-2-enyl diphosphate reductase [Aquificaceae bacterium]|nr:4-hydroxy-3-methylbut-2-enyl diphosphate reductase [Aquificaceae bacterium]MCS7195986.1 4-hydroxy-3-methylbut-2-enyl diphosphate reductase [Aquificaceae bacterium]MDW8032978.1 4-hydroxy-3-methylbut-2-enyl diphosphate reductase [Aquificaceae bacterium]MDW8294274.1 4-hydroxy-3-methylbut-2-enyl diphosphate reductase [Aquificaceae bacterium]